jgi:hypothetical protein
MVQSIVEQDSLTKARSQTPCVLLDPNSHPEFPNGEYHVMCRPSRIGFTLVDLLAVIAVVVLLLALLIPSATPPIDHHKQAICQNHLNEIGTACAMFENSKCYYPPECSNTQVNPIKVPWPALLVNQLGRGDLGGLSKQDGGSWSGYMEVFTCPSNPIAGLNPTTSTPLHYAANVGRKNVSGSSTTPSDWKENGVFMPQIKGQPFEKVSSSFVNSHDGLKSTLLVMETVCSADWGQPFVDDSNYGVYWTGNNRATDPKAINDPVILAAPRSQNRCYISSKHPAGANVVFCAGNTLWLSDHISADVIDLLMTPYGKNARSNSTPGSAAQTLTLTDEMYQ